MAIYKRWKGQKITPEHPRWKDARWIVEFMLKTRRIKKAVPEARTQAQAERAEIKILEDVYNRRYGGGKDVGFSAFFEKTYLPWLKAHFPASYRDAQSRGKELKDFFGDRPMREFVSTDCDRLKAFLKKGLTVRKKGRAGGTINRYVYLLSAVFRRAVVEEVATSNPCKSIAAELEKGRERYLTPDEEQRLQTVLVGDLGYLKAPIAVSLGTGLRKRVELLKLKCSHVNFTTQPMFLPVRGGDVEVPAGWLLVVAGKGNKHRLVPMNSLVRETLAGLTEERSPNEFVFNKNSNGVSEYWLKWGFEEACGRAAIIYGETKPGGIVWHDLRRTFATRLRENGVHEYDIQDLLGHAKPGVTKVYARSTVRALEAAVAKLTEPWGQVVEFNRRLG